VTNQEICIMGADPGASGAVAFYFPSTPDRISVHDVPLMDGEIDGAALASLIAQLKPSLAMIERVNAMPKQGVSSTFNFGMAFGTLKGVVSALHIPTYLVTPGRWKKHFRLTADKEEARALAIRMWPSSEHFRRKKDHGRAEAALLAKYATETVLPGALT
jgi:hypothetical protein